MLAVHRVPQGLLKAIDALFVLNSAMYFYY